MSTKLAGSAKNRVGVFVIVATFAVFARILVSFTDEGYGFHARH
jgi:hypothetical protein